MDAFSLAGRDRSLWIWRGFERVETWAREAMKLFSTATTTTTTTTITATSSSTSVKNTRGIPVHPFKTHFQASNFIKFDYSIKTNGFKITSSWSPSVSSSSSSSSTTRAATDTATKTWDFIPSSSSSSTNDKHHWMVVMEKPDEGFQSKSEFVDYYVRILAKVLGSEKEAQMCIYNTSWQTHFGFCCDVDEETSRELARLPEVLSVRPDPDIESVEKDYSLQDGSLSRLSNSNADTSWLFPEESTKYWLVRVEKPAVEVVTKAQMVDHYAQILAKVLGCEMDAQMCIYHVSWQNNFGFCCVLDEESAKKLGGLPEVLSVRPNPDIESVEKDYSLQDVSLSRLLNSNADTSWLFPEESTKYWLVRVEKPAVEVVTKAQMVDHYAQILAKVLGCEMDAQMCIYHVSWQNNFGFCCVLDEESAKKLGGVPGIQSVQSDKNFGSENKDYGGDEKSADSSNTNQIVNIKTKRLFVTGLSFYTSEKTLRAAFEGFGELVEVKIIMDKISKRSKGYAFIEYTTEEAASAAHTEMNGKIINGWMIVVDVAKTSPPKFNRGHPRPMV